MPLRPRSGLIQPRASRCEVTNVVPESGTSLAVAHFSQVRTACQKQLKRGGLSRREEAGVAVTQKLLRAPHRFLGPTKSIELGGSERRFVDRKKLVELRRCD